MLKELHLVSRVIYTLMATFALSGLIDISMLSVELFIAGVVIFSNSFLFQYFVLHFALKEVITTPVGRLYFLLGWAIACIGGLVLSAIELPQIEMASTYANMGEFKRSWMTWFCSFMAFSSAFVALTCTRRAFTRHGALG